MADENKNSGQPPTYQAYYPQDEISFNEVLAVFQRRWLIVVGVTLLLFFASLAYVLTKQSVYESRSVIRVGVIGGIPDVSGDQPIEPAPGLIKRLVENYRVNDATRPELPRLDSIVNDKTDVNTIEIIAHAHSPEEAQSFLTDVTNSVLLEHHQVFDRATTLFSDQTDFLRGVKSTIDLALAEIDEQVERLTAEDTSAAALFALEKSRLLEHSLVAEGRIAAAEIAHELRSYPSSVLREPTLSSYAISPRRLLISTLSLVLGLGLGFAIALFLEFFFSKSILVSTGNASTS